MSLKPLILARPRRERVESRSHHLLRLALDNCLPGMPALTRMLDIAPRRLLMMTDEALAQYLRGIDLDSVSLPMNRTGGALELIRLRLWNQCRICPLCIQHKRVSPLYFDFSLSLRCEEHQIFLLDRCPSCSREFTYSRKRIFHCDCGLALANLPQVKVDSAVDLFESLFASWRENKDWYLDEDDCIPREIAVARALRTLLDIVTGRDSTSRSRAWIRIEDWPLLKTIISPWPHSLLEAAQASITTAEQSQVERLLCHLNASAAPALIKLRKNLIDSRAQRSRLDLNGTPMIPLNRVRTIAKLDAAAVKDLFDSNFFKVKTTSESLRGITYWVSEAEVASLAQWFQATVNVAEAAEILGCTPYGVRGLIRMKLLSAEFLPTKARSPRIRRSVIDAFQATIKAKTSEGAPSSFSLITLANISPMSPDNKHWRPQWFNTIEGVLDGRIPIFRLSNNRGWAGIGIRPIDLGT